MQIIIYCLLSIVSSYLLTRKRAMSFGWGLFFSLTFSFIIGIIVILISGKYGSPRKKPLGTSQAQHTRFIISIVMCILFLGQVILPLINGKTVSPYFNWTTFGMNLSLGIGFLGNIIYIYSDADTYVHESL